MAPRKKPPAVVVTKSKPSVVVFHLRDFTVASSAVPAFDLPPAVVEAPFYVLDHIHKARNNLYRALPEPPVADDVVKRAFTLADAILDLITDSDDVPVG